jgi:hypothetical protein
MAWGFHPALSSGTPLYLPARGGAKALREAEGASVMSVR